MMYANKMAVAIKTNGRVLRENKDTVYCPFGAEYSILIKNLNTVRAVVNVFIDGEDMLPNGLVLNAHQEIDLERSIKNGNLNEGNKFKFIERTGKIEQHRGIKLEDGLVRVEFQFEMPRITTYTNDTWQKKEWVPGHWRDEPYYIGVDYRVGINSTSAINSTLDYTNISATSASAHIGTATMDCSLNDAGITVPGSKSEQKFQTTTIGTLDPEKHTIILKILGETPDNKIVSKPVTVKTKQKCVTCGKQNKITAKFCADCGTSLSIFA